MTTVAVLGLGAMGAGLARNLLEAGHDVTGWNRTPGSAGEGVVRGAGGRIGSSPRDAAEEAQVVLSMVTDDDASRQVWLDPGSGAAAGLGGDAVAVECSTLTPAWIVELAGHLAPRRFLEAPVLGSLGQLAEGNLVTLVGGDAGALDAARDVLAVSSARIEHLGRHGDAARLKLLVNALLATQTAAYAEVVGALEASPLDDRRAIALLRELPITSPAMQRALGLMEQRKFAPSFPVRLVAKDLGYAVATSGVPLPVVEAVRAVFDAGVAERMGDDDISGIVQRYVR